MHKAVRRSPPMPARALRPAAAILSSLFSLFSLAAGAVPASADQAQCLDRKDADAAAALLRGETEIRHFCSPCRDEGWRAAEVATVSVVSGDCGAEVHV